MEFTEDTESCDGIQFLHSVPQAAIPSFTNKGNWTKKLFFDRTHAFDPKTKRWEELPEAPISFGYAAYAVVENRLFVLGGYDGQPKNGKILALSRQGEEYVWEIVGELPQTRVFGWASGLGTSLYLLVRYNLVAGAG